MKSRFPILALIAVALGATALPVHAGDKPQRIVSINLCTDQLVMLLVPRERIRSVSFLAADPASSAMVEAAKGLHLNHGLAEEILSLRPDIVLAGAFAARPTVALLRRLGQRVVDLPLGHSIEHVTTQVRIVAAVLGEEDRGEALLEAFRERLAALPAAAPGARPRAVLYESSGVTSGPGSLPDAVMVAAGFDNLARESGIRGVGRMPIEAVIAARPDVLIRGRLEPQYPSLASATLDHPALARVVTADAVVDIADSLWSCATPLVISAIERLAKARARLARTGGPS